MNKRQVMQRVKDAIRNPYAWPGGYPRYVILSDGGMLCRDCARAEFKQIAYATRHNLRDGWGAMGVDVLWETEGCPEQCAHCNKELESAYGNIEEKED